MSPVVVIPEAHSMAKKALSLNSELGEPITIRKPESWLADVSDGKYIEANAKSDKLIEFNPNF